MPDADQTERLRTEAEELAKTIRRQLYVLVVTGFYLVLALSGPDAQLVRADASISWPLIRTEMQLSVFLTFAPIALVALLIYLHLFVGRLTRLERQGVHAPETFIFAMSNTSARLIADLLLYAFVPIVLMWFTWKTLFREEAVALVVTTLAVTVACASMHYVRAAGDGSAVRRLASVVTLGLLALSTLAGASTLWLSGPEQFLEWRQVDLVRADLAVSDDKPFVDLGGVDLRYADLREARLVGANLREADLSYADLTDAILGADNRETGDEAEVGANLEGATLTGAKLANTDLRGVNLKNANLQCADLRQAILDWTDFRGAILTEAILVRIKGEGAKFNDANLEGADLGNAELEEALFVNADLKNAILTSAKLTDATFGGADLSHADFEDAKIRGAYFGATNLYGTNFRLAVDLEMDRFTGARYCKTVLPDKKIRNDDCENP